MARQARIDYPGAFHHIMCRGFKREKLFFSNSDYQYYLDCLAEFSGLGYKILEFILMPNHIHLLMRTGEIALQRILKSINTKFALYRNYQRKAPGPIFQGRPKSILIVGNEHLKVVGRYILRNAVKANVCKHLSDYKWSSYNYMTKIKTPSWYDNSDILEQFGSHSYIAIKEYREYIRKPLKSDDREYPLEKYSNIAVGSKIMYEKVLKMIDKEKRVPGRKQIRGINWEKRIINILKRNDCELADLYADQSTAKIEIKKRIAYVMKEIQHKESYIILEFLKISAPTLSRYIRDMKQRIKSSKIKLEEL